MRWVLMAFGVLVGLLGIALTYGGAVLAWHLRLAPWWELHQAVPAQHTWTLNVHSEKIGDWLLTLDPNSWQIDAFIIALLLISLALGAAGAWLILSRRPIRPG